MRIIPFLKNGFKRYVKRFYVKIKRSYFFLIYRNQKKNILLVYTMGKVGSSTIYESLKEILPFADIFHVHFLSDDYLRKMSEREVFHKNYKIGKEILMYLENNNHKRIKIITLVREPLMRDISDVFENYKLIFGSVQNMSAEKVIKFINASSHSYCLNWFDEELKKYLGFDIYTVPFDKERGWGIYNLKNADVLCIKLEKLNEVCSEAFKIFLDVNLKLMHANVSENKELSQVYKEVKKIFKADASKISLLYNSKYVNHFYTRAEIEKFIAAWSETY